MFYKYGKTYMYDRILLGYTTRIQFLFLSKGFYYEIIINFNN